MARQAAAALIPAQDAVLNFTTAAGAASAQKVLGKNVIFAINADQDVCISFGISTGGNAGLATAGSYRIPANQQVTIDLGSSFDQFSVWNLGTANGTGGKTGSTTANVYVQRFVVTS